MILYDINGLPVSEDICHHGVKGQKWGVRRYQNPDGTLTELGKKRVSENATLFPKDRGKKSSKRDAVAYTLFDLEDRLYTKEYVKYIKNNPEYEKKFKSTGEGRDYWRNNIYDGSLNDVSEAITETFINQYAKATLRDLNLSITPEIIKYTEELIRSNGTLRISPGRKQR